MAAHNNTSVARGVAAQPYLSERHFASCIGIAMALHLVAMFVWILMPNPEIEEVPTRTLNIKLGDNADLVVPAALPAPKREAAIPAPPKPAPKKVDKPKEIAKPVPAPKPEPALAIAPKVVTIPNPPVQPAALAARTQADDSKPLGHHAVPQNAGSVLGTSASEKAAAITRYEQQVASWVKKHRAYPSEAQAAGIKGSGNIFIAFDRKGNLLKLRVLKSTGYGILDQAMLQMGSTSNPFPAPPADYFPEKAILEFNIPISLGMKFAENP